ncbi:histidine kinase [Nocardiopsis flavescens]|uniref:histidine kinase n=1 Tax=Nocardiopsis flavescens TaxID=758803 RepID=A0A1M6K8Q2_9ACTN|nr:histidine kinase [Nocardiopsis flavescens]SHJ55329.1 Signal transduction histidine kinase [Nocardiopsis flavescens]
MGATWAAIGRSAGYLVASLGAGLVSLVLLPLTAAVVVAAPVGGAVLLPGWVRLVDRWARWHRTRAARLLGAPVPEMPAPETGLRGLLRARSTRRLVRWLPFAAVAGTAAGLLGLLAVLMPPAALQFPFWWALPGDTVFLWLRVADPFTAACATAGQVTAGLVLLRWAVVPAARVHARLTLTRLTPSHAELLAARVDELSRTRADVVDSHGAELRRIERDLHDGTQARLVSIALQLGVAKEALAGHPDAVAIIERAHEGTEEAMAELRELIRGIHPPVLADRGLVGALESLAGRTQVPVRLDAADPGRLPEAVETAAYFVVTEAVTNAVRHGSPTAVDVSLARDGGVLRLRVSDDGSGGVDEARGTGVRGIRHRAAALDGTVAVSSPAGGPTVITVELPCGS